MLDLTHSIWMNTESCTLKSSIEAIKIARVLVFFGKIDFFDSFELLFNGYVTSITMCRVHHPSCLNDSDSQKDPRV